MRILVAALIVATLQVAAPAPVAAAPLCGFGAVGIAPMPDGKTYVLEVASYDGAPFGAVFDLHSQLSDYRTAPAAVTFTPIAPADAAALRTSAHYVSAPVFVSLPKMDALLVARASVAGDAQAEACTPRAALTTAYFRREDPDYQPSAAWTVWRQRTVAAETRDGSVLLAPEIPYSGAKCERPNARVRVERLARPEYPEVALQERETGVTAMAVEVGETGAVTGVTVLSSGGNPALDAAAVTAAKVTEYRPAAYHCLPVPGIIVIRSVFREKIRRH